MTVETRWSRVLLPTDLRTAPAEAYALALALAVGGRGELTTVHVTADWSDTDWSLLPVGRKMLADWGVLPEGSDGSALSEIPLSLRLHARESGEVLETIAMEARRERSEIVVMATHAPSGRARLFSGSVASAVARRVGLPSILIPLGAPVLVDPNSGEIRLKRVLVAEGSAPPERGLAALARLAAGLGAKDLDVELLHVGSEPVIGDLPHFAAGTLRRRCVHGEIVDRLAEAALDGQLVVTETAGHDSLRDVLTGSVTERLTHGARRVVLTVPR